MDRARELLEDFLSSSAEDRWRGRALGLLARVEEGSGRPERARELLRQAIDSHWRQGDLGREISDRCLLVRVAYYDLGDFAAAAKELENIPRPPPGDGDSHYLVALYRGTLALYSGNARSAYADLAAAQEQRDRVGNAQGRWVTAQMLARLLRRLGRAREAQEQLEELTSDSELLANLAPCQRAELLNNVGWDRLLALEGGTAAGDPRKPLLEARELHEAGRGCPPSELPSIELNLALADLHGGDPGAARRRLDDAEKHGADASPRLLLWQLDLEARLDLQGGKLEAARRGFSRLAEAAEAADSLDARWRAQSGLAQVAEAAGRNEVALEAFARTEALLDEISLRAPLGLGRVSSADPGGGTTRRYLDLLLSLGREEKALEVARRSRSRILRGLLVEGRVQRLEPARARLLHDYLGRYERLAEELDEALASDWQVPGSRRAQVGEERRRQREDLDRLLDQALALIDSQSSVADPGALERQMGEVVLLYHPVSTGWVGFAVAEGGLRTVPLPDLDPGLSPEELGSRLLEPFREELSFASKVRVLGFGWLRLVDFHLLPVGGETLLARAAVVYGLDLPAPIRPATELHRRWALVVADPTETLSAVREEARAVASRLEGFGFSVSLRAGAAAHRREVLERLGTVEVFHFAGHAETSAGLDGALLLSRGGRLTVGDVLAASSLPESVVLSACGSASSASEATDPFLGLAQAFLVAGSREVLATSRPVPDEAAARVVTAIYRHWDGKMPLSLALHRAWLEEGNEAEEAWGAFRIFER